MIPSPPQKVKFKYLSAAVFHYNPSDNSKWEYYDNYTAGRPPHTLTHLTQSVLPEWIPSHLHNAEGALEIVGGTTTEFCVPDHRSQAAIMAKFRAFILNPDLFRTTFLTFPDHFLNFSELSVDLSLLIDKKVVTIVKNARKLSKIIKQLVFIPVKKDHIAIWSLFSHARGIPKKSGPIPDHFWHFSPDPDQVWNSGP